MRLPAIIPDQAAFSNSLMTVDSDLAEPSVLALQDLFWGQIHQTKAHHVG